MKRSDYLDRLKQKEGFSYTIYPCSESVPTAGWGFAFNIGKRLPMHILQALFDYAVETVDRDYKSLKLSLDPVREYAVKDMLYQMGLGNSRHGFKSFKKLIAALRAEDYPEAAAQVLDSEYGRKHPTRATENSHMILTGLYRGMP